MKGEQIDPIRAAAVDVPTPMFLWMKDFNFNSLSMCVTYLLITVVLITTA